MGHTYFRWSTAPSEHEMRRRGRCASVAFATLWRYVCESPHAWNFLLFQASQSSSGRP